MKRVFSLVRVNTHHYTEDFVPLDGDIKKVDIVDKSIDNGINPLMRNDYFLCGRAVHPENLPAKMKVVGAKHKLADYIRFGPRFICSDAFRETVEQVEPGVHQFEPVELVWKNGATAGNYFFVVFCNRISAIDESLTYPPLVGPAKRWRPERKGEDRLVFSADRVAQNHFFYNLGLEGYPLCSGEAHDALTNTELTGFRFDAAEVA